MMTEPQNIFLTENRRDILNQESDWSDSAVANERSRINKRTKLVLEELTEIAQSPVIENENAFPPELVAELFEALFTPTIEPAGYDEYRRDLYYHTRRAMDAHEDI